MPGGADAFMGALGGVAALLSVILVVFRSVARQVRAIIENTESNKALTEQVTTLAQLIRSQEKRIARLEDTQRRPRIR